MSRSERSHVLLAFLCLLLGVVIVLPIMPFISVTVFALGVGVIGLYILVRLWPSARREETDGSEEDE